MKHRNVLRGEDAGGKINGRSTLIVPSIKSAGTSNEIFAVISIITGHDLLRSL
jgi:hypothetical protein